MRKLNRVVKISTQVVIPITAGQITRLKKTDAEFRKNPDLIQSLEKVIFSLQYRGKLHKLGYRYHHTI